MQWSHRNCDGVKNIPKQNEKNDKMQSVHAVCVYKTVVETAASPVGSVEFEFVNLTELEKLYRCIGSLGIRLVIFQNTQNL